MSTKSALERYINNQDLAKVLEREPRLHPIFKEALGVQQVKGYNRVRTYIRLRNMVIPLIGWYADQRLGDAEAEQREYEIVIHALMDLLPRDAGDIYYDWG